MNVQQLLTTKSKEQAAFIMFEDDLKLNCLHCKYFQQDKFNNWKCTNDFQAQVCWNEWEFFLTHEVNEKRFNWGEWKYERNKE